MCERRKSYVLDGYSFPLPRKYAERIYSNGYYYVTKSVLKHYKRTGKDEVKQILVRKVCRSRLQDEVIDFTRIADLENFIRKLRENSGLDDLEAYFVASRTLDDSEEASLEERAMRAKKYYLNSLKKQKYG